MLTKDILKLISHKLRSVIYYLIVVGVLFFVLAVLILFYPEFLQIFFIIAFFVISFAAFLIAVKINNIKEHFDSVLHVFPKKKK